MLPQHPLPCSLVLYSLTTCSSIIIALVLQNWLLFVVNATVRNWSASALSHSIGLLLWQEGEQQVHAWRYGLSSDSDAAFAVRMGQLRAYQARIGDAHVGFRSTDDAGLSRWAHAQRSSAAEGCMSAERCVYRVWMQVAEPYMCLLLPYEIRVSLSVAWAGYVGAIQRI